jgi:phosphoribosylanthranilate isomerase
MSAVAVKICGITSVEDGLLAARFGAQAIGLVFWPKSPRFVEIEKARAIAAALPPFVARVGVFVDAPRDLLVRTAESVGLDVLQLHGAETPGEVSGLPRRVLKALRVAPGFRPEAVDAYARSACGILLDSGSTAQPGGTGQVFDWSLAQAVRERVPHLVLAGGLTAENVAGAIAAVRPDAVDVSTGVESEPGRKDEARLSAFMAAVARAV